jgi:hypothetical protein
VLEGIEAVEVARALPGDLLDLVVDETDLVRFLRRAPLKLTPARG